MAQPKCSTFLSLFDTPDFHSVATYIVGQIVMEVTTFWFCSLIEIHQKTTCRGITKVLVWNLHHKSTGIAFPKGHNHNGLVFNWGTTPRVGLSAHRAGDMIMMRRGSPRSPWRLQPKKSCARGLPTFLETPPQPGATWSTSRSFSATGTDNGILLKNSLNN